MRLGPIANVRGGDGKAALGTSEKKLYPKESALIDPVAAGRMEGRRVLVYATDTGARDITGRMDDILTRHEFRVTVMKFEAVAPDKREAWVEDKVKRGIDVLVCHPRLVQKGLDLIETFSPFTSTRLTTRSASCGGRDASASPGRSSWCDVLPEHPSSRRVEAGG